MTTPDSLVSAHGKIVILRRDYTVNYDNYDEINEATSTKRDTYIKAIVHKQAIRRQDRSEGFPELGTVYITVDSNTDIQEDRDGDSDQIIMNNSNTGLFLADIVAVDTTFDWFQVNVDYASFYKWNPLSVGDIFVVSGSTGNNGTYTINGITISGSYPYGLLTIDVAESVVSSVADGLITSSGADYKKYVVVETKDDIHPIVNTPKKTVLLRTLTHR